MVHQCKKAWYRVSPLVMHHIKMKNIKFLFLILAALSCSEKKGSETIAIESQKLSATVIAKDFKNLVLYEDSLNGIKIPFENKDDLLNNLKLKLNPYSVKKEKGQQDGPDFPLYTVQKEDLEILFFSMDSEDTLNLNDISIKSPLVKDMYGLKVGDSYSEIKSRRKGNLKNYTDFHQHTFLFTDNSNIMYEISGSLNLPADVDLENIKLTEEQIKDWKIENIVWRKK